MLLGLAVVFFCVCVLGALYFLYRDLKDLEAFEKRQRTCNMESAKELFQLHRRILELEQPPKPTRRKR